MPFSFSTTVTLVTSTVTGQDVYGKDIIARSETLSAGWAVWPASSNESTQSQDIITDTLVALAPSGVNVAAIDQVKVLGRTYEVQGATFNWSSPLTGTSPGRQVNLRAVTG